MGASSTFTTAPYTTADNLAIDPQQIQPTAEDAPLVRYVQQLLQDAALKNASDIHFEPYEHALRIRLRIDGLLYEIAHLPIHLANRIISRLKVMAELDIAERRIPQDGRFKLSALMLPILDCRLNTCPTIYGEKAVVRLLEGSHQSLSIDKLGFTETQQALFLTTITKPQGMILVTGPTGSGKTVTLHAALSIRNKTDVNISTVEDPVEIHLPGINQININPKAGLHFATVLRALLRQDPDIIMVGEIRDAETAEIAVQAAQTGHLVLSTLHTNSAAETLTRLISMGIPTYNIAASLSLIVAQRLVRRLCPHCKQAMAIPACVLRQWESANSVKPDHFVNSIDSVHDINSINSTHTVNSVNSADSSFLDNSARSIKSNTAVISPLALFAPKGCEHCHHGYKGRIGIYELLPITSNMAEIIMSDAHALTIAQQAQREGMLNLYAAGLTKVFAGITSLQELERVIRE